MIDKRRLTPAQRRRDRRLLAALLNPDGRGEVYLRHDPDFRSARRLHRAGLCCAVASKSRPWMRRCLAEVTLFRTRADALKRYPATLIMRDRSRK